VFHVKGNHFAQAEAEDGEGFSGFGGQGIEVEDEDADDGVREDDGDGAGARGNLPESGADGGGNGFWIAQVRFTDAGEERAGRQGSKA
jgi:hypothetical protein